MMTKFNERLRYARKTAGLTQAKLAQLIGVTQQTIQRWELNEQPNVTIVDLALALNVSPTWLAKGRDDFSIILTKDGKEFMVKQDKDCPLVVRSIPVVSWAEVGSTISRLADIQYTDKREFIPLFGTAGIDSFALKVEGSAMSSGRVGIISFTEGDYLIVDPDKTPEFNHFVIAFHKRNKKAVFRKLEQVEEEAYLVPLNPQFEAVKLTKDYDIIAVYVSRWTP
jgi:SOS-response transcriptional repressor LexA